MAVAVTGAAGFLGTNLVQALVDQGREVIAIDRFKNNHVDSELVTWVEADVLDPDSIRLAIEGASTVFHLVAMITLKQEDELAWRVNTEGVRNTAEAALDAGVSRFIHCGSIHAFDQYNCGGYINEQTPRSVDSAIPVYDRSKWQGELELREVIKQGLDAVVCNPTGIYGPTDFGLSRINGLLRNSALGKVPVIVSGAFDLVDVRDVVQGLLLAEEKGVTGENYLLSGQMMTMPEAFAIAAHTVGRRGPLVTIPGSFIAALLPVLEPIGTALGSDVFTEAAFGALLSAPIVDGTKARKDLGYEPRPAETTIRELIAFLVETSQLTIPASESAMAELSEPIESLEDELAHVASSKN